jgi:Flp pilus assembly protein TadG
MFSQHCNDPSGLQKHPVRARAGGYVIIKTIALMLFMFMFCAFSIDFGLLMTNQNLLQTSADAAALAGASRLFRGTEASAQARQDAARTEAINYASKNYQNTDVQNGDVAFGYVNPQTLSYNPDTFSTPANSTNYAGTGGFNAVRVTIRANASHNGTIPTIFAKFLGINQMDSLADAVAIMDNHIGVVQPGGLRPIYGCNAQYNLAVQNAANNGVPLTSQVVRVYGDKFMLNGQTTTCALPGSGNWGFADFNNCSPDSPGASDIASWFATGYPGTIDLGQCYSTAPGNFISNNNVRTALDNLINQRTVILIPLASNFQGTGSNTHVDIVGYTGFVITNYLKTGPASDRYIEGYFTSMITANAGGNPNAVGGGAAKLRLIR